MTALAQLLADLKAASESTRALDCAIAMAIDGFFVQGERYGEPVYCYTDDAGSTVCSGQAGDMLVPRYTGSVDAALRLLAKTLPGYRAALATDADGEGPAAIVASGAIDATAIHAKAPTLPLALCIAIVDRQHEDPTREMLRDLEAEVNNLRKTSQ